MVAIAVLNNTIPDHQIGDAEIRLRNHCLRREFPLGLTTALRRRGGLLVLRAA
jgi:hypothetical protein